MYRELGDIASVHCYSFKVDVKIGIDNEAIFLLFSTDHNFIYESVLIDQCP